MADKVVEVKAKDPRHNAAATAIEAVLNAESGPYREIIAAAYKERMNEIAKELVGPSDSEITKHYGLSPISHL